MDTASVIFTADGSGGLLSFVPNGLITGTIDNVRLQKVEVAEISALPAGKEFLVGNTDDGGEITFRADTQYIQLMDEFETFAIPLAIVTKSQRGSLIKCFVALGDDDFYELDGSATKGTSLIKVHPRSRDTESTPGPVREIRISWRDSSKQLCRLTQGGVIFLPATMSYTE